MRDYFAEAFGEPTPKQKELYEAKTRFVGYGGAKGGGKSHGVRAKMSLLADEYPGIKILVIRKRNKDLKRNYIRPLQIAYSTLYANKPEAERPKFNVQDMMFTFPNGSTIEFGFCDSDADADDYRGAEWDILILDEATELTKYQIGTLVTCVRGVNKFPKRIYITFNPGGVGHMEIKRLFWDKDYERSERAKDYSFIPARVWDNIPLMMSDHGFQTAWKDYKKAHRGAKLDEPTMKKLMYSSDYVRGLDNLPKVLREAYLNGNMDIFSGQYFSEFNTDIHVIDPIVIQPHWKKTAAIDYGLDTFAALWFATDEHGQTYCYRGHESVGTLVSDAGKLFRELSRNSDGTYEDIEFFVAPFDMWNKSQDTGIPKITTFAENCGIPYMEAGRDRESGWVQCKEYLKYSAKKNEYNEQVVIQLPRMLFFSTCGKILDFIPELQFDPKKPSDTMKEPHEITHSPDAWRYWCSTWQTGAVVRPEKKEYHFNIMKPKEEYGEVNEAYAAGGY